MNDEIKGQISFSTGEMYGNSPIKITKPIRLIELFGGIGAQSKALENLGADFEVWNYCEIDRFAVQPYNAVHGTNFTPTDITKLHAWVKKAAESNTLVVMLLPARTDTKWFHEYIYNNAEVRFLKGRVHFNEAKQGAPFPSMVVVFRPH